jgi:hypothetical protein
MKFIITFITIALFGVQTNYAQCYREAPFPAGPVGDYAINGTATISFLLNGTKTLAFDSNFSTDSGPDLHVYLSQSSTVSTPGGNLTTPNTIDLGLLQSPSGAQNYDLTAITPSVNLDNYTYVIIHCKQYDHGWGAGTFGSNQGGDCASLLSVENFSNTNTKIYPTIVTNNELYIESFSVGNSTLNIFTITGQKIRNSVILNSGKNFIDTSSFEKGIYLIQITNNGNPIIKKIIIR